MKLCYFDESGTGLEPVTVVVGVVVDSHRMHVTKDHWGELLDRLSAIVGKPLAELHTRDFYAGNGAFRGIAGGARAKIINEVVAWFCARKHSFVYSAIHKQTYEDNRTAGNLHPGLGSAWQAAAFHCVLSLQRAHQRHDKAKGHTILVFDNKGHEEPLLVELVAGPPVWSETYYGKKKKQTPLPHIIDAPYFAQSHRVPLADSTACRAAIPRDAGPAFHGMPGHRSTASRAG
jgi:hypothetical protein